MYFAPDSRHCEWRSGSNPTGHRRLRRRAPRSGYFLSWSHLRSCGGLLETLKFSDHGGAQFVHQSIPSGGILDDVGLVERGAQDRRVCDLPAIAAADAAIRDMCNGVLASGSLVDLMVSVGQPDSRMQE